MLELLGPDRSGAVVPWIVGITAAFLIGAAAGGILFGWLGDRIGRVKAMVWSVLTYSIFSFLDGHDKLYYRRGLGLPLVWGEIPQVWAKGDSGAGYPAKAISFDAQLLEYVRRIVELRTTYGYPFVVLGRMLRPPQPTVPSFTIPAATRIPYSLVDTKAFDAPSILSSAWQSPSRWRTSRNCCWRTSRPARWTSAPRAA